MAKEESGNAREIIKKWMPIGIWIAAVMIVPYLLWIDEKKIITIHSDQHKRFNSALFTIINTFDRIGRICNVWNYDGGKTLERKKRKNP